MKRFSRIFFYLRDQKGNIALYFIFNFLSVVFSLVSLAGVVPFLQLLFKPGNMVSMKPVFSFTVNGLLEYFKYYLSTLINEYGPMHALAAICVVILISIFFKNLFYYLTLRTVTPIRNRVMTRLRADMYTKILMLPIGYFTEQRKGDIISRMSNDSNEVEWSIMGTLEGLIRDPLQIIVILAMLVYLSPLLSLFLLVLLPVTGFIIGRVSRSLKSQSNTAQEYLGVLMSILDETLTGLRVIKAFTAEKLLSNRFFSTNDSLNRIRNKMNFKRDLASPLSEFLGVLVMIAILWFGGKLVFGKGLNPDTFILYILSFTQIINPAKSLSTAFYNAQRGSAAIQRIFRNIPVIRSYRDSQGFRKYSSAEAYETGIEKGEKLLVKKIDAPVFHYNGVRPPEGFKKKAHQFGHHYRAADAPEQELSANDSKPDNVDRVEIFKGTHPQIMQEKIAAQNWTYTFNPAKAVWKTKDRVLQPIEDLLGFKFGEYKNYKLIR